MLQNGRMPAAASPAEKVTAWPSAMPTSKQRSGMALSSRFIELPDSIAGVTPATRGSSRASSTSVWPKTSWYLAAGAFDPRRSPVAGSKRPGACHTAWSFSAGVKPLPFTVITWSSFGPSIPRSTRSTRTISLRSWPSTGPK